MQGEYRAAAAVAAAAQETRICCVTRLILFRSSYHQKQMVYHDVIAIRAVWRESFRPGPPKAQPPGNAQAHERQTLAISGERSQRRSTEGEQRSSKARDLSGPKDRGAKHTGARVSYFFCREVAMGLKTALYDTHVLQGAKIVDFGGWEMPLHYGSQIEEHHAVRRDAGMFDVSHMGVVDLTGERVREFLRNLLANDVCRLRVPGKALYSCMLLPGGGVIDDLIVYFVSDNWFRVVVNAGTRDKDVAWIRRHAAPFGVSVVLRLDLSMIAIQGPNARAKTLPLLAPAQRVAAGDLRPFFGGTFDPWF